MAGSAAERHLRDLVVDRLRIIVPGARIIHELNVEVGACRVDVAAVQPDRLLFVEIKSRKDKLDRLKKQALSFRPACHRLAVAYASERWSYDAVRSHSGYGCDLWPEDRREWWTFSSGFCQPNTSAMLNLLWRDELWREAVRANFQPSRRASRSPLMEALWRGLTGDQVVAAVCRQLRVRVFAEADAPIFEEAIAA